MSEPYAGPVDVLVVGWSDIVRRRVLPALHAVPDIGAVHVCTAGPVPDDVLLPWHADLRTALEALPEALVYVSGINTVHAARVRAALAAGHPVVVDKPAVLDPDSASALVALAREQDLLLAEAVVWPYHPQVAALRAAVVERGLVPTRLDLTFTIPSLPDANFRTRPAAGGGVVADMGAYAMSPASVLGLGEMSAVHGAVARDSAGLDIRLELEAVTDAGVEVRGRFAIGEEYANRLVVAGHDWAARLEPAFSSRPDAPLAVHLTLADDEVTIAVPAADAFAAALGVIVTDLRAGATAAWVDRTEASMADLLTLASAAGVVWPPPTPVG